MTSIHNSSLFYRFFALLLATAILVFTLGVAKQLDYANGFISVDDMPAKRSAVTVPNSEKISEISQHPDYPTGCESVSLYILLRYYDVEVTVSEIIEELPKGMKPIVTDGRAHYGGNPEREFVSDPADSGSYGVYEQPIAQTASLFLDGAVGKRDVAIEELDEIIKSDPVIAWISLSPDRGPEKTAWRDSVTGADVEWISGEHAVVVYGICADGYMISDPNLGEKRVISREEFEIGFFRHGGRIVYYPKEEK